MTRVPLITSAEGLDGKARETFAWIAESRGEVIRPFAVLMHRPEIAQLAAELGAQLRFGSTLRDEQRELAILATGSAHRCVYQWASHIDLALRAGVRPEAAAALEAGAGLDAFTPEEAVIVGFARGLATSTQVDDGGFEAVRTLLGTPGVVELSSIVGYYSMLAVILNACAPGLD